MKKKMALSVALVVWLFGVSTVFAVQETVPVSELQPAVKLDKPQLYGVGGKLVFSDSPKTIVTIRGLYRDRVDGEF